MFRLRRKEFLRQVVYKDLPFFSLNGYKTWGKVVKQYDGDSCTIAMHYKKQPYKFKTRLTGIDTAEIRTLDPIERRVALQAKERLAELIGGNLVYVECFDNDKYGRLLCNLYSNKKMEKSFNDILVEEGLAGWYNGGKKSHYRDWYTGDL